MMQTTRRRFLGHLGGGAALFGMSPAVAAGLGLRRDDGDPLRFGALEELVEFMQTTRADALLPLLVQRIDAGVPLARLVAAGALANARAFAGEDYTGYHVQMALQPSLAMAGELPGRAAALPVLKVLHRNARRLDEAGRASRLKEVAPRADDASAQGLRRALEARDLARAERTLAALAGSSPGEAYGGVLEILRENLDVHRVVLTWRSWDMLQLTGEEHAQTLLRQPVRFCVRAEEQRVAKGRGAPELRALLPELLERHELPARATGARRASDAQLDEWCLVVFGSSGADAARAAAGWLAEGYALEDVGEALSLAANRLLLHDPGRASDDDREKPRGSVHGASVGVHASDSARAWRNIAGVCGPRDAVATLVAGAYHTAGQAQQVGAQAFPYARRRGELAGAEPAALLAAAGAAVEAGDQERACAAVERYGEARGASAPLFALLLESAVAADGALHAEKYYRTAREDFAAGRPAHCWRYMLGLARVCASQRFRVAPGLDEARELLGV
jgi:hypothetical protein